MRPAIRRVFRISNVAKIWNFLLSDWPSRYLLARLRGASTRFLHLRRRTRLELLPLEDRLVPTGGLQGLVWNDSDADGFRDSGESGWRGVTVALVGPAGTQLATTNANGAFGFANLTAGNYTLQFGDFPGSAFTSPASGTTSVTIVDGSTGNVSAGISRYGAVTGSVWADNDRNGNGARIVQGTGRNREYRELRFVW